MTVSGAAGPRRVASAVGAAALAVVLTAVLGGCDGGSRAAPVEAAGPPSSASVGSPSTATGAATQTATAAAGATTTGIAVPADAREVCDHAQDAFRSGDLGDAEQSRALATELQGMADVARPEGARLLAPLVRAAEAVAADGRATARPAVLHAQDRAVEQLRRSCVAAGSTAWPR